MRLKINHKSGNRLVSHDVNFYKAPFHKLSEKSNEALHSAKKDRERLSRVILNLGVFFEAICNQFTEDTYLPCVVCTVFGFVNKAELETCYL